MESVIVKYKCWDEENQKMIYEDGGDQNNFQYLNGVWKVTYIKEITIAPEGIEMDVPVQREVENPLVTPYIITLK